MLSSLGIIFVLWPEWGERVNLTKWFYYEKPIWRLDLGNKYIYVPLLVIVASIAISGFVNGNGLGGKVTPLFFGIYLFGAYLAARKLGKGIFLPFVVCVVVEAISCVVYGVMYPGERAGGIVAWSGSNITGGNYAIAVRFLVFGAVVGMFRYQWLLWVVALVGLIFTGCEEAAIAVGVLGLVVLFRQDWGKKLLVPAIGAVIILAVLTPMGITYKLIQPAFWYAEALSELPNARTTEERVEILDVATNNRWTSYVNTINSIAPVGHGYNITHFYLGIPHNVPLVIIEQVGIVAAVAWLFLIIYCLVKTKWKYAFTAVLVLSVFDHALWTQAAPWVWVLVGVATSSTVKSDLVFKKRT